MEINNVNVDRIGISKLVERKSVTRYLIGCLDYHIRSLVLMMAKIRVYVKIFKVKDGGKDQNNNLCQRNVFLYR